jgi:hypothetical protein
MSSNTSRDRHTHTSMSRERTGVDMQNWSSSDHCDANNSLLCWMIFPPWRPSLVQRRPKLSIRIMWRLSYAPHHLKHCIAEAERNTLRGCRWFWLTRRGYINKCWVAVPRARAKGTQSAQRNGWVVPACQRHTESLGVQEKEVSQEMSQRCHGCASRTQCKLAH